MLHPATLYRIGVLLPILLAVLACKGRSAARVPALPHFSFFLTSLDAMQRLSGSQAGFGGDLSFGESGEGAGLRGADKICTTIAEASMPGAGAKQWRAFLSATRGGPDGGPVHAAERIGHGPWYDRIDRLIAMNKADLLQQRPASADEVIKNDLPNELGVPNHNPDGGGEVDNHDVLTGTNAEGQLYADDPRVTCNDWTKSEGDANDAPRVGHSWPRSFGAGPGGFGGGRGGPGGRGMRPGSGAPAWDAGASDASVEGGVPGQGGPQDFPPPGGFPPAGGFPPPGAFPDGGFPDGGFPDGGFADGGFPAGGFAGFDPSNWMSSLDEAGCAPSVNLGEMGPPRETDPSVGSGGGYGGIYCFALTP